MRMQLALTTQTTLRPRLVHVAVGLALAGAGCAADSDSASDEQNEDNVALAGEKQKPSQCYTTRYGEILPVDLDTEQLGAAVGTISQSDIASLGAIDRSLVTCGYEGIQIVDLDTNETELIARPCHGVTSDGKYVWVNSIFDGALYEYKGLKALRDDKVNRTLRSAHASRLGFGEGRLLAAWHSAAEVLAIDLDTGESTAIPLPGYDGWIFGLAERGDERYVVGGWVEKGIRAYDRVSGEPTRTLFADEFLQGLACTQ